MDVEKLIERLRTESLYADKASLEIMDLCMDAAAALATLQTENKKLRAELEKVFPGCEKCRNQANWPSWIEKGFVYCPKCGTPLTSWAWEKQVERLEALYENRD